ncbi:glyoxalase [Nguyenibacter vanlangensis]|uniref:Glyoxalase n=1 Tax=Nguyenibacter vanlangensis TaxID=1216886 RepID=A0A7Y7ITQ0_9PROT|nr:glyoxalase [Nguyenibacter vanlangensis]NVN09601.1 glyoxalase [Nguyenibacter vanlangensis]
MMRRLFLGVTLATGFALASVAQARVSQPDLAVGPQYDTTHVYVAASDVDRFVSSFLGTFGGSSTKQVVVTVTPTPSTTSSQLLLTPVGTLSVFGFRTPVPFPFGSERDGYFVTDLDEAVKAARADGAEVYVETFPDPIGRDALVRWPGDVTMQLYWHTAAPHYPELKTTPENRVYISPDRADAFVRSFTRFSHGTVTSDDRAAPGVEIGRPGGTFRRIRLQSKFGRILVLVTDGHLPYPYGRETTGYEVADLGGTLDKARANGAEILVQPFTSADRSSALVLFPGGYIAEIHATQP